MWTLISLSPAGPSRGVKHQECYICVVLLILQPFSSVSALQLYFIFKGLMCRSETWQLTVKFYTWWRETSPGLTSFQQTGIIFRHHIPTELWKYDAAHAEDPCTLEAQHKPQYNLIVHLSTERWTRNETNHEISRSWLYTVTSHKFIVNFQINNGDKKFALLINVKLLECYKVEESQ